jgi:hypothetical protein
MKPKLLTLILLILALYSYGQVIESIGLKGGISFSNQTYHYRTVDWTFKYDYKPGIYSTLTAELFKGKFLSLSTDLGFIQKGTTRKVEITTPENPQGTGEYTMLKTTIGFISLSPMLKGLYSFKSLTTYALIGPRIDYWVSYEPQFDSPIFKDFNKLIWGITYGVGVEYKIKKLGILIECLGQPDISAILNQKPLETNSGLKIMGNAYIITTGLRYYLH